MMRAACPIHGWSLHVCALAVLNQMWPHVSSYIVAQAHPQLDPLLEQNRPSWMEDIKLTKCAISIHLTCPDLLTSRACIALHHM